MTCNFGHAFTGMMNHVKRNQLNYRMDHSAKVYSPSGVSRSGIGAGVCEGKGGRMWMMGLSERAMADPQNKLIPVMACTLTSQTKARESTTEETAPCSP